MTRRDMAFQVTLALGLILGIVGGNFVLHRWVLGNTTSREADAGTAPASHSQIDLDEFAPPIRSFSVSAAATDPVVRLEQLRRLIAEKLPHASAEVRDAWLEELSDVSLKAAEGILDLRGRVGTFPEIDETAQPRSPPAQPPELNFSIGVSR